ncbi:MAG: GTP-binding protein [Promethearchaeota archaeon]|nr:MAG: GTP-binding protein [Candidatus Lokiarchaeota archaeon]
MDYNYTFKIMLFGELSSGKENLIKRYVSEYFDEDGKLTRGVDFCSKTIDYKGKIVKLQFWDLADEPHFRYFISQYCKGANGTLVLFDVTNAKTLDRLREWNQTIKEHAGDIPIMLVGNERILDKPREISREKGNELVKKFNLSDYTEISTMTGEGIEKLFQRLAELLLEKVKNL